MFQKRLSRNEITKDEEGRYHFVILPEETDSLHFGKYYFDIQLYRANPTYKQTVLGELEILPEITFAENE
ncbi:MAG: hypothetical protein ACOX05_05740 [Bacillota bacterium]